MKRWQWQNNKKELLPRLKWILINRKLTNKMTITWHKLALPFTKQRIMLRCWKINNFLNKPVNWLNYAHSIAYTHVNIFISYTCISYVGNKSSCVWEQIITVKYCNQVKIKTKSRASQVNVKRKGHQSNTDLFYQKRQFG